MGAVKKGEEHNKPSKLAATRSSKKSASKTIVPQTMRTEEALQERETRYRILIDQSSCIILEWDPDGNVLFLNPYGLEFFGFSTEEILGRNVLGTIVSPIDSSGNDLQAQMDLIQDNPNEFYSSENENVCKNGEKVWIAWTNKGIYSPNGNLLKILSFGIDRTQQRDAERQLHIQYQRIQQEIAKRVQVEAELKESKSLLEERVLERTEELTLVNKRLVTEISERNQAEEQLATYRDHLEKLVEERTVELEQKNWELEIANSELLKAKEAAESADRVKSAFLATMSHELRTPLNSIIGFTGVLQQELVGPLNEEQKKQMGMVRSSSAHLLNLINDVLDISKIEAGQLTVAAEPCDLQAAIEKVTRSMQPLVEKKGLSLEVIIAPDVGTIMSDQRRVEQIIFNLISNAIKFTGNGIVRVRCIQKDGELVTSISDTGIGIKKGNIDQLFKPFQQVDSGMVRQYEGTGLGLSICKKILDLLGGRIWVESEWGKGSVFSFALPVQRRT